MISFTYEQFFGLIILGPFAIALLIACGFWGYRIGYKIFRMLSDHMIYTQRMKEVVAMKARGEHHEWITIAISTNKNGFVCKKTGYCPDLHGFFDISYIQQIIKEREKAEDYRKFRDKRIEEIADQFGINIWTVDALCQNIIAIPQQYAVLKLDNLQKELKGENKDV